jgi:hypothetical protein
MIASNNIITSNIGIFDVSKYLRRSKSNIELLQEMHIVTYEANQIEHDIVNDYLEVILNTESQCNFNFK